MKNVKFFFLILYGFFNCLSLMGMKNDKPISVIIEDIFFQNEINEEEYTRSALMYIDKNSLLLLPASETKPNIPLSLSGIDNLTKLFNKINNNKDQERIFLKLKEYQKNNNQPMLLYVDNTLSTRLLTFFLDININKKNESEHFTVPQSALWIPKMTKKFISCCSLFALISVIVIYIYKYNLI